MASWMEEELRMEGMLAASLAALAVRADEFGRGSWTGPNRAALEKAIIRAEPLLDRSTGLGEEAESLRSLIQSACRALLAKMKTAKVEGAQFDADCLAIVQACHRLLSILNKAGLNEPAPLTGRSE
jgi:hypothetical protein